MSKIITPTVGRVVHFYPNGTVHAGIYEPFRPSAATISRAFSERLVNLGVIAQDGRAFGMTSVVLLQPGDDKPAEGTSYCEWMPYQIEQSADAEPEAATDDAPQEAVASAT